MPLKVHHFSTYEFEARIQTLLPLEFCSWPLEFYLVHMDEQGVVFKADAKGYVFEFSCGIAQGAKNGMLRIMWEKGEA